MRIPCRTGAVHRPRRPIIGSPDAQPAATPDSAVGDANSLSTSFSSPSASACFGRPTSPASTSASAARRSRSALPTRRCSSRRCSPSVELWLRRTRPLALAAGARSPPSPLLIVVSAIPNGASALTAAGKLSDFAVLALGAAAFIDTRQRFASSPAFLVAFCTVAVAWGAVEFVVNGGKRQGSFMGEHDLAALSTMALVVRARASSSTATGGHPTVALVGIVVGALGIVLGASLASLLGLYLADGGDDRARAGAPRPAPPRRRRHRPDLRRRDCRDVRPPQRRPRLPAVVVRAAAGDAGPVRRELEPAADLRLHRRPRLPRQPGLRHRLGGRAAAARVRAVPPRRARALLRPAAALLPAGDGHAHPAADVRPGALRARARRGRRSSSCWSCLAVCDAVVAGRKPRPGEPWGERPTSRWAGSP